MILLFISYLCINILNGDYACAGDDDCPGCEKCEGICDGDPVLGDKCRLDRNCPRRQYCMYYKCVGCDDQMTDVDDGGWAHQSYFDEYNEYYDVERTKEEVALRMLSKGY